MTLHTKNWCSFLTICLSSTGMEKTRKMRWPFFMACHALLIQLILSTNSLAQPNATPNGTVAACTAAAGPTSGLHAVRSAELRADPRGTTQLVVHQGGSKLQVRFARSWSERQTSTRMRVFSKLRGTGPFNLLCQAQLPHSTIPIYQIDSPWGDSSWRVEFEVGAAAPSEVGRIDSLALLSDSNPDLSTDRDADLWEKKYGAVCQSGMHGWTGADRLKDYYGGRAALQIEFSKNSLPSDEARERLTNTLLSAVTLWADACVVCRVDHLAVVSVNGRRYVKESLVMWHATQLPRFKPYTQASLALAEKELASSFEPASLVNARDGTVTPVRNLSMYRLASGNLTRDICAIPALPERLPLIRTSQAALCYPTRLDPSSTAKVVVSFVNGRTFCGDSSNIIACRADNELTEYNIRDFRFMTRHSGKTERLVGDGAVEVDLLHVVLHEMGHWIGLPDLSSEETIMAGSLETSRCIDDKTVSTLRELLRDGTSAPTAPLAFTLRR